MKKRFVVLSILLIFLAGTLAAQREPPVSAEPIWEVDLRGTVIGLPALQAETAVVVLGEGDIKTYSRFGNWMWTYHANEALTQYVTRSREGTTYACTESGTVIAINRVGRELWKLPLNSPLTANMVTGWDGRIFMPMGSRIYCRTASGYSLWMVDLDSPIFVKPVIDHRGGLAMVLNNNEFVLVSHLSMVERFQLDSKPLHIVPLDLSGGKDSFILLYANGAVQRIFRDGTGKLAAESFPSLSQPPVAAIQYKEHVAVTLRNASVQLLSAADGSVLWTGDTHESSSQNGSGSLEPYWAAMQFDERGVYMLSAKGVTGFRTSDGARLWLLRITGAAAIPSFSDEGYLYSGGTDRFLHAYRIEERRRNVPRSIYGPRPEGSYGLGTPPPSSWANLGDSRFDPTVVSVMYDEVSQAIQNGQIGASEPDYVAYLMEMAGISLTPGYSPVRPKIDIENRTKFIYLLGYLGSQETIPFLANLFSRDREPIIRSACCEAIGRIGVDPAGNAIRAYNYLLSPDNAAVDPSVMMAAATSAKNLARFSGPPLSDAAIRLLRTFTATDLPAPVKLHAQRELSTLFR
jgi:outer membrane protein assembly factor BamB